MYKLKNIFYITKYTYTYRHKYSIQTVYDMTQAMNGELSVPQSLTIKLLFMLIKHDIVAEESVYLAIDISLGCSKEILIMQ